MPLALDPIRSRLGNAPRSLSPADWEAFALSHPSWLAEHDLLKAVYADFERLVTHGTVVPGVIAMANPSLWEPGDEPAPAEVVYTTDPSLEQEPEVLTNIADELYTFHEDDDLNPREPWRRHLVDEMADMMRRHLHHRIPPTVTHGRLAYHGTVMVFREHLPQGHLTGTQVPLLVLLDEPGPSPAMIIPSRFWTEAMRSDFAEG